MLNDTPDTCSGLLIFVSGNTEGINKGPQSCAGQVAPNGIAAATITQQNWPDNDLKAFLSRSCISLLLAENKQLEQKFSQAQQAAQVY
ncbi:hypothetical protein CWE09_00245 [Aliidiomarina minuta]|uniref:Uncharacterized protein n=1 Tax=Aliidiomarina minuta TaxID=880057 RepID=A0A432W595_9GAMM|nr:hypothetical protein [Aliidiomarina minuta]RUO25212.1 hypothetical protein CWE09_00245 [Aliidiomarina minuta]